MSTSYNPLGKIDPSPTVSHILCCSDWCPQIQQPFLGHFSTYITFLQWLITEIVTKFTLSKAKSVLGLEALGVSGRGSRKWRRWWWKIVRLLRDFSSRGLITKGTNDSFHVQLKQPLFPNLFFYYNCITYTYWKNLGGGERKSGLCTDWESFHGSIVSTGKRGKHNFGQTSCHFNHCPCPIPCTRRSSSQ